MSSPRGITRVVPAVDACGLLTWRISVSSGALECWSRMGIPLVGPGSGLEFFWALLQDIESLGGLLSICAGIRRPRDLSFLRDTLGLIGILVQIEVYAYIYYLCG